MSDIIHKTTCPDELPKKEVVVSEFGTASRTSDLNGILDDKFDAILQLPKCLRQYNRLKKDVKKEVSLDSLEMSVRSFPIPELTISSKKLGMSVGSTTITGSKYEEQSDITIQFRVDDRMKNYYTLYRWMNMVVDVEAGDMTKYSEKELVTSFSVFSLDQYRNPIGAHTFHGVSPVSISGWTYDQNTNGEEIYVDFTFAYNKFTFDLKEDFV